MIRLNAEKLILFAAALLAFAAALLDIELILWDGDWTPLDLLLKF